MTNEYENEKDLDEAELKESLKGIDKDALADIWAKLEVATILLNQGKTLMRQVADDLKFHKMVAKEFPKG